MTRYNKYGQVTIHPYAHEMLHRISNATYIHMNYLVGMCIAHEAHLLVDMGRDAYLKQCDTKFEEAGETLDYFEPSDSEKYSGRIKIFQTYLAKLREIAWSINVRPQDFLSYVISSEYSVFIDLNTELYLEQYMRRLGDYRKLMNKTCSPETSCIYKVRTYVRRSPVETPGHNPGFIPANELKKGGDSLL